MHSEPSKIVVTGIIVSAVAIVALVSQSGTPWLSKDDSGPVHGDEPVNRTLGNMVSGVVKPGRVVTRRDAGATKAGAPQAARQNPPLNDPGTAQTQLEMRNNDGQAHADTGQHATSAARVEKRPPAQAQAQAQPQSPLRTSAPKTRHSHSHETRVAVHGAPANHAPRNSANDQKALDKLVARLNRNSGHSAPGAKASVARAPAVANQSSAPPVELKGTPTTNSVSAVPPLLPPILSAPQAESTSPAALPSPAVSTSPAASPPPAVQSAPSEDAPVVQLNSTPKSRAQVRTEIGRAREDGSLPAFGNPNPAGPGGAPSLISTPRP